MASVFDAAKEFQAQEEARVRSATASLEASRFLAQQRVIDETARGMATAQLQTKKAKLAEQKRDDAAEDARLRASGMPASAVKENARQRKKVHRHVL